MCSLPVKEKGGNTKREMVSGTYFSLQAREASGEPLRASGSQELLEGLWVDEPEAA